MLTKILMILVLGIIYMILEAIVPSTEKERKERRIHRYAQMIARKRRENKKV